MIVLTDIAARVRVEVRNVSNLVTRVECMSWDNQGVSDYACPSREFEASAFFSGVWTLSYYSVPDATVGPHEPLPREFRCDAEQFGLLRELQLSKVYFPPPCDVPLVGCERHSIKQRYHHAGRQTYELYIPQPFSPSIHNRQYRSSLLGPLITIVGKHDGITRLPQPASHHVRHVGRIEAIADLAHRHHTLETLYPFESEMHPGRHTLRWLIRGMCLPLTAS